MPAKIEEYSGKYCVKCGRQSNEIDMCRICLGIIEHNIRESIPEIYRNKNYFSELKLKQFSGGGWYIVGGVGTGKTQIAYSVFEYRQKKNMPTHFENIPKLLNSRNQINEKLQKYTNKRNSALLILDDLGSESSNDYNRSLLYELINERYCYNLPTLVTSNMSIADIAENISERLASRLFALCRHSVELKEDKRIKEKGLLR